MALPKDILARAERVYAYHRGSKYLFGPAQNPPAFDSLDRPKWAPLFPNLPTIALPMDLLDVSVGTLSLMESSLGALPGHFIAPQQNLQTLASWLYFGDGVLDRSDEQSPAGTRRTWASEGATYPTNLYVAVFDLEDLESGLYHYSPDEFVLRKLRNGPETLNHIKRGRPDLGFLKSAPAAILVSTAFGRASWRYGSRAYRTAVIDAGQLTQSLTTCASGLGIQTMTRLRMTDSTMRELIGLSARAPFHDAEAVQSMVIWADRVRRNFRTPEATEATEAASDAVDIDSADIEEQAESHDNGELTDVPIEPTPVATPPEKKKLTVLNYGALSFSSVLTPELVLPSSRGSKLPPIARGPQSVNLLVYGSVTAVHQDCVSAGIAVRQIRPPVTEISPLPPDAPTHEFPAMKVATVGEPLRKTTLGCREPAVFSGQMLPRDVFRRLAKSSLAAGTFFPLLPDGPHAALLRSLWIINAVADFDPGLWYYDAKIDGWSQLRSGSFRFDTQFMALDDGRFGSAAAVCILAAGLPSILGLGGPDTYRLALLEAGTAAHRMRLAAAALGAAAVSTACFYDDEIRGFFGLSSTGWEPIAMIAVGVAD